MNKIEMLQIVDVLENCIKTGGKILICSDDNSEEYLKYFIKELIKSLLVKRPLDYHLQQKIRLQYPHETAISLMDKAQMPIPVIALIHDNAVLSAENTIMPENKNYFAQQVSGLGKKGDVLIGICSSENVINSVYAFQMAKAMGITTLAFTNNNTSQLAQAADKKICISSLSESQELFLSYFHAICTELECRLANAEKKVKQYDLSKIQLIVFDFDGVFTDNKVYVSQDGCETVCCSRADSLGLSLLKKAKGPECCILSTEENPVVAARAKKLAITCFQGCKDKKIFLQNMIKEKALHADNVLYMGNDLNDLEVMKIAGVCAAPADAHEIIKNHCEIVLNSTGGNGAIRELCDMFLAQKEK